ncbi:PREDICTED: serine protease 57 [Mandrillus leucophaeus]|uniref:serine protease 57 n=1 Tax=Mandrillus leucophaeus TaxID=9568 RepID=UPI0005F38DB7|nr:PREDICTED: serine protease 57 [Mandrillus leucophaeus]
MGPGSGAWGRPLLTVATALMLPMKPLGSWGAQIIGGHEVTPHSRPYMVSVRFGGQHHCGGFLLRARWVISAAHCFSQRSRGGEGAWWPELMLSLQLNGSAVLGPAVGLLRLPGRRAGPPTAGTRCRVAGWGFVSDFEDLPPGLMEAEVRVLDLDVCNSSWKGHLSHTMLCTRSGDRHRRGFCSADSGGPLVCRNRAHGLVSFSGLWTVAAFLAFMKGLACWTEVTVF